MPGDSSYRFHAQGVEKSSPERVRSGQGFRVSWCDSPPETGRLRKLHFQAGLGGGNASYRGHNPTDLSKLNQGIWPIPGTHEKNAGLHEGIRHLLVIEQASMKLAPYPYST